MPIAGGLWILHGPLQQLRADQVPAPGTQRSSSLGDRCPTWNSTEVPALWVNGHQAGNWRLHLAIDPLCLNNPWLYSRWAPETAQGNLPEDVRKGLWQDHYWCWSVNIQNYFFYIFQKFISIYSLCCIMFHSFHYMYMSDLIKFSILSLYKVLFIPYWHIPFYPYNT